MGLASPRVRACVLIALAPLLLAPLLSADDPPSRPAPAPVRWDPERTWAFLVGLLKKRGVPEEHIVFLKDLEATKANIETSFQSMMKRTRPGDFLFLYFQGNAAFLDDDSAGWVPAADVDDFKPKEFAAGSKVFAYTEDEEDQRMKKRYPATVERVFCGMHLLTYEGKPDFWTEWAPASRIKNRP